MKRKGRRSNSQVKSQLACQISDSSIIDWKSTCSVGEAGCSVDRSGIIIKSEHAKQISP